MDNILYIALNLILTAVSTMWIAKVFFKQRYLFIKPSIMLLAYTHVFFQWPFCFLSAYYFKTLNDPYTPAFLINGYVLIGLLISANTLQDKAKGIWDRISAPTTELHSRGVDFLISILALVIIFVSIIYLCYVPFKETGLYAILNNSEASSYFQFKKMTFNLSATVLDAAVNSPDKPNILDEIVNSPARARERSLKLLDSTTLQYLYSLCRSSIVPFLFSLITLRLFTMKRAPKFRYPVLEFLTLFVIITLVSFPGERYSLALLILLAGASLFWQKKLDIKFKTIALIIGCALLPAVLLNILREGRSILDISLLLNYSQLILNRAFLVPLEVGMWYVDYAQTIGPFGLEAFPKIAAIFGIEPVNASHIIATKYFPSIGNRVLLSSNAGAGYLFSYYGYLGAFSFPICLLGLWALDIALIVFSKLNKISLIPTLASISIITLQFISSDYTVCWLTHGFGGTLLVALCFSQTLDVFTQISWRDYGQTTKA